MKYLSDILRAAVFVGGMLGCTRDYSFLEHSNAVSDITQRNDAGADAPFADGPRRKYDDVDMPVDAGVDALARDSGRRDARVGRDVNRADAGTLPLDIGSDSYRPADARADSRRRYDQGTIGDGPRADRFLADVGGVTDARRYDGNSLVDARQADGAVADLYAGGRADGLADLRLDGRGDLGIGADGSVGRVRRLIFRSNRSGNYDIYSINPENPADIVNLTNHPAYDEQPAKSLDGRIAFVSNRARFDEIYVMDGDGSNLRSLGVIGQRPCWSPDGTRIIYTSGVQISAINADGTNQIDLGQPCEGGCRAPSWSPDGVHVAYYHDNGGIAILNIESSSVELLTPSGILPDYSPDGRTIVFFDGNLKLINVDRTDLRDLGFYGYEPSFTVGRIAYSTSTAAIELYNIERRDRIILVSPQGENNFDPDW